MPARGEKICSSAIFHHPLSTSVQLGQASSSQVHPPHLEHHQPPAKAAVSSNRCPDLSNWPCWEHPALSACLSVPCRFVIRSASTPPSGPSPLHLLASATRPPPAPPLPVPLCLNDQRPRLVSPAGSSTTVFRGVDAELMCSQSQSVAGKCPAEMPCHLLCTSAGAFRSLTEVFCNSRLGELASASGLLRRRTG